MSQVIGQPERFERPLAVFEDIRGVDVHVGDTIAAAFRASNQGELRCGTVRGITRVEFSQSWSPNRIDVEVEWETSSLSWGRVQKSKISPERVMKIVLPDPKIPVIDPIDVRVDVFRLGITTNDTRPDTFPSVRLTHLKTGIVVSNSSTASSLLNKQAAWDELEELVAASENV